MDQTAKAIENHKNLIQSTSGTIASIGLTKAGEKVAGVLVTPAVWVLNYSTDGSTPDKVDVGLYATGFFGTLAASGAVVTGTVKAVVVMIWTPDYVKSRQEKIPGTGVSSNPVFAMG